MALTKLVLPLSMIVAAAVPVAAQSDSGSITLSGSGAAPAGGPETKYCLRIEPVTGTRLETIQCKTREDWAELELDVDQEWADNGVRVIS